MSDQEQLSVSSAEFIRTDKEEDEIASRIAAALEEELPANNEQDLSPAFKELREPKLPALTRENRARLQMQTPNRVYFYWSMKNNPWQVLNRAFGDNRGSYTLVVKLVNLTRETEEIHPIDAEGNWWFTVDADSSYRAEVGFYAPNRPYFRALYSNTVTTPRKSPSARIATEADWIVTSDKFAKVLDLSGFKQDAVEVALAGDDHEAAEAATREAFGQFIGQEQKFEGFTAEELRYALLALASGVTLEELRFRISASLYSLLQANFEKISGEAALSSLRDHFEIETGEIIEEEPLSAVYGASLVHFPITIKRPSLRSLPDLPSSQYRCG